MRPGNKWREELQEASMLTRSICSANTSSPGSRRMGVLANPVVKAALISGAFCALGDTAAQVLSAQRIKGASRHPVGLGPSGLDTGRLARMGTFGLFFYGPYQHHWYGLLERSFPTKSTQHFLTKVTLNQLALAPVVLTVVFSWNLVWQKQSYKIPSKIKRDLIPTMINGWKFWVPAAALNFWRVPLQHQVLYMSTCSVLWTAYLSYVSNL